MSTIQTTTEPAPTSTAPTSTAPATDADALEALGERVVDTFVAACELLSIRLGADLGLYEAFGADAVTAAELADRAGVHPRYAREWVEQQAVAGLVDVAVPHPDAHRRRYALSEAHRQAFCDPDSAVPAPGFATSLIGLAGNITALAEAYRTGGGVGFTAQGDAVRDGQGAMNRPSFTGDLAGWVQAVPEIDARLRAGGARVLDIGAGTGWSAIALARAYPDITVHAIDLDEASVEVARRHVAEEGLADRITVSVGDASQLIDAWRFDVVTIFEALHDMAHPVEALRRIRRLLADDAVVLIADERVAEAFTAPGDTIERLMYGWSTLHCLPATMAEGPSVDAGTVLRPATMDAYAVQAGYEGAEVLDIDNDFWRFYRLSPRT